VLSAFVACVRYPRRTALVVGLLLVPMIAGALRLEFADDYRALFRADTPAFRLQEQIDTEFGREDNDVVVLLESEDFRDASQLRRLAGLHEDLEGTEGVAAVYSLISLPDVALALRLDDEGLARRTAAIADWPLVRGRLLSEDGSTALLVAHLGSEPLDLATLDPIMQRITEAAARYDAVPTGLPELRREIVGTVKREQVRMNLIGVVLASIVSLMIFRHPMALAIAGAGPILGVLATMSLMGWVGEPINVLNVLVAQLVLVIGLTDAIHLLHHTRRRRAEGQSPVSAAIDTVLRVGPACLMTSLTTAAGFASLYFARSDLVRRYGIACAAGALVGYVAVMAVVPVLTTTRMGAWLDRTGEETRVRRHARLLERLVTPVLARPALAVAVGLLVMAGMIAIGATLRPDYRFSEALPAGSPQAEAIALREDAFGGSAPLIVRVGWQEGVSVADPGVQQAMSEVADALVTQAGAVAPTSVRSFVMEDDASPQALRGVIDRLPRHIVGRWLNEENRAAVVVGSIEDIGSAALQPRIVALREALRGVTEDYPGIQLDVTGLSALSAELSNEMLRDLVRSLSGAVLVIVALMAIALRSLRLGLVCLLPNLLPLAGAAAALRLAGLPLQYSSVGVMTIGLGLAVDDTIHFVTALSRVGGDRREAVLATVRGVGVALVTTTSLLVCSLIAVTLSPMPTIRTFGWLLSLLLVLALLADLLILPPLMLLTGNLRRAVSWAPSGETA